MPVSDPAKPIDQMSLGVAAPGSEAPPEGTTTNKEVPMATLRTNPQHRPHWIAVESAEQEQIYINKPGREGGGGNCAAATQLVKKKTRSATIVQKQSKKAPLQGQASGGLVTRLISPNLHLSTLKHQVSNLGPSNSSPLPPRIHLLFSEYPSMWQTKWSVDREGIKTGTKHEPSSNLHQRNVVRCMRQKARHFHDLLP